MPWCREGSAGPTQTCGKFRAGNWGEGMGQQKGQRHLDGGKWEESLHIILSRSREEVQEAALMLQWRQRAVPRQVPA